MIVSGYSMHLYCANQSTGSCKAPLTYRSLPEYADITGETYRDCARQARKIGWKFRNNDVTCPYCTGKRKNADDT